MPIYEFFSPDTNRIYTFFARSLAQASKVPRCPDDPSATMERLVSRFAVTGRKTEEHPGMDADDDPRLHSAMAEMEREIASMDQTNPDPKAIGRLMRRMAETTGQSLPEGMKEMVRRLEAGEDPEGLEKEFGDVLENMDFADAGQDLQTKGHKIGARRMPSRDPRLYEMSDYL